jgi:hypothetical protein
MLTNLERLSVEVDGRYATPEELDFLKSYFETLKYRISAYQKIQKNESEIIHKIKDKLHANDPKIFIKGAVDFAPKWRLDTVRVLRYSALALLIDDPDYLQQRLLIWFATVLQAFQGKDLTRLTYQTMLEIVEKYLTPEENKLFLPLIKLNLTILCKSRSS